MAPSPPTSFARWCPGMCLHCNPINRSEDYATSSHITLCWSRWVPWLPNTHLFLLNSLCKTLPGKLWELWETQAPISSTRKMPGSKLSSLYEELLQQLEVKAPITSLETSDSLVSTQKWHRPQKAQTVSWRCWGVHLSSWKVGGLCWNLCPKLGTKQVSVSTSGSRESEHQLFHPAVNDTLFQHVFPSVKSEDKWRHEAMPIDKAPGTLFHG